MASNIIIMVSDGLGYNGWLASDYYWHGASNRQIYQQPRPGNHQWLHFGMAHWALSFVDQHGFPVSHDGSPLPAGASSYMAQDYDPSTRWQRLENARRFDFEPYHVPYASYTDSAASATALFSGQTTTICRLNMNWNASERFTTIGEIAHDYGLATGVVTTVQTCHATPAGVIAHNAYRNNLEEIFQEQFASGLSVLMGTGHPHYDDDNQLSPMPYYQHVGGEALWNDINAMHDRDGFRLLQTRTQFESLANNPQQKLPQRVIGIAQAANTLQAGRNNKTASAKGPSGMAFNENVPSLATMSQAALNVLGQREEGFFLLVEGGAVDWMNHCNEMPRMLEEQHAFNQAIETVVHWVERHSSWDETLLVITADHECGGIWGEDTFSADPGENYNPRKHSFNGFKAVQNRGRGRLPGYQYASTDHTNDLVPLWTLGRGAERFREDTRIDEKAAQLWGQAYNWDGQFVHNTDVFRVMNAALKN